MQADLELEAVLNELMTTLSESELESEAEWEAAGAPSCPRLAPVTVGRFPRYAESIASLPPAEQQKVRRLAEIIVRSHRPGCRPVLQVNLVGHADRDYQRGPDFEHRISAHRALTVQRALQRLIGNPKILPRIVWHARGAGARHLIVPSPRNEAGRSRNRRVEVALSAGITANYPVLVKIPSGDYSWVLRDSLLAPPPAPEAESHVTFPDPIAVSNSQQVPFKWICSLLVDFGDEVLPGPIVTGKRIHGRGSGTLIGSRHVLTAGHVLLTQGPPQKDIFGNAVTSTTEALSVDVIPGRDGGKVPAVEPQGRRHAIKRRVSPAWKDSNATNRAFDYGLITLDAPVSADYGFWSSANSQISPPADAALHGQLAHCSGYPADSCPPPDPAFTPRCDGSNRGTVQFQMSGDVTNISAELLETQMKIQEGHSGSPTWLTSSSGAMNLVGIASASRSQAPEIAVRIRSSMLDKIRAWMREDGVRPAF